MTTIEKKRTTWRRPVVLLRACPRCGGDLATTHDRDVHCVQCGWYRFQGR